MAELTPLPANPTNGDLAKSIEELHTCFESHRDQTALQFRNVRKTQLAQLRQYKTLGSTIEVIRTEQQKVKSALGVEQSKKPIGLFSQTRLIVTLFGAATAAGGVWRFVEFMWPSIWSVLKAIRMYVLR